jgi:hypothetical protein
MCTYRRLHASLVVHHGVAQRQWGSSLYQAVWGCGRVRQLPLHAQHTPALQGHWVGIGLAPCTKRCLHQLPASPGPHVVASVLMSALAPLVTVRGVEGGAEDPAVILGLPHHLLRHLQ